MTLTVFAAAPVLVGVAVSAAVVGARLLCLLLVAAVVGTQRCLPPRHRATLTSTAHPTNRVAFAVVVEYVCQQFSCRLH